MCRLSHPTSAFWLYNRASQTNRSQPGVNQNEISKQHQSSAPAANEPEPTSKEHQLLANAPIELQFEINAEEPPEEQPSESKESAARGQPQEQPHQSHLVVTNGSAILEDLVNQLLARKHQQHQAEQQQQQSPAGNQPDSSVAGEQSHKTASRERKLAAQKQWSSSAGDHGQTSGENGTTLQLERLKSAQQDTRLLGGSALDESNLVASWEDQEDRHIQYDVVGDSVAPQLGRQPNRSLQAGEQVFSLRSSSQLAAQPAEPNTVAGSLSVGLAQSYPLNGVKIDVQEAPPALPAAQELDWTSSAGAAAQEMRAGPSVGGAKLNESQPGQWGAHQARQLGLFRPGGGGVSSGGGGQSARPPYASSYPADQLIGRRGQQFGAAGGQSAAETSADSPPGRDSERTQTVPGERPAADSAQAASSGRPGNATAEQAANLTSTSGAEQRQEVGGSWTLGGTARPASEEGKRAAEFESVASRFAPANELAELEPSPPAEQPETLLANNHQPPGKPAPSLSSAEPRPSPAPRQTSAGSQAEEVAPISERFYSPPSVHQQADQQLTAGDFPFGPDDERHQLAAGFDLHALPASSEGAPAHFRSRFGPGGSGTSSSTSTTVRPHNFSSAAPSPPSHLERFEPAGPLNRRTFESVRDQIHSLDGHLLAGGHPSQPQTGATRHQQHQQQQQQQSRPRPSPAGHAHAASLLNVTAPMVPPLSASEAMETERQQAVGLLPAGLNQRAPHFAYRPNGYYVPAASPLQTSVTDAAGYSRPANSLASGGLFPAGHHQPPANEPPVAHLSTNNNNNNNFPQTTPTQHRGPAHWVQNHATSLAMPSSYLNSLVAAATASSGPAGEPDSSSASNATGSGSGAAASGQSRAQPPAQQVGGPFGNSVVATTLAPTTSTSSSGAIGQTTSGSSPTTTSSSLMTTNGFVTSMNPDHAPSTINNNNNGTITLQASGSALAAPSSVAQGNQQGTANNMNQMRLFNLTRVEHISAECSNDLIRTVIIFNGTFKGLIYSSGYVHDPNCLYINGTGKTRYDFSIRLNQCGTTGRQELHSASGPNKIKRRDQVMWNALSIQYNPAIEQEWDEHFRVSCEYGSDFWKTISFNPFNVETNTGSPVVFTVEPPQCQMEILRGHGTVGPRQEAISGPVTVGDPLTLLVHMKSERGKLTLFSGPNYYKLYSHSVIIISTAQIFSIALLYHDFNLY